MDIARSGITILVDKMTLVGLVKRRQDPDDRRITKVIIEEKGYAIMKKIFPNSEVFRDSTLGFLQQDEKELFYRMLKKMKERFENKIHKI